MKTRFIAVILLVIAFLVGWFVYSSEYATEGFVSKFPFKLGLDLNGGTHLVYKADVSKISPSEVSSSMDALRDVIERRINLFGVSEPIVQVEQGGVLSAKDASEKLIVELPGVTDISKAVAMIGKTPMLEFKLMKRDALKDVDPNLSEEEQEKVIHEAFVPTGLNGSLLKKARVEFMQNTTNEPVVILNYNKEGQALLAKITKENIGQALGIFLDGERISSPVIRQEIRDGSAQISGNFTIEEAKTLVRDLNYGALPVPIELASTQTVGASLGEKALHDAVKAGFWSFIVIGIFLILWYRLPGLVAVVSLAIYTALMLALFKFIPVTLTAAGIAAFVLSLGMAVDANILIFERMKEELHRGRNLFDAMKEGFHRAWLSIRDSNLSSIITGVILFYLGSSSVIKGFALVFIIGVIVSMLTAISISRTFLLAVAPKTDGKTSRFLFSNGFHFNK
jgi:preprotein translocase subunit SecD